MSGTYDFHYLQNMQWHDEEQNIKARREPSEIKVKEKNFEHTYIQWYNGDRNPAAAVLKASTTLPNRQ